MAQIHVLAGDGHDTYTAVIHVTVPSQNNNVGVNLRTAIINSGIGGTSIMAVTTGTAPGKITTTEMADVTSGIVYEVVFVVGNNQAWTNAERLSAFSGEINSRTSGAINYLVNALAFFGNTQ